MATQIHRLFFALQPGALQLREIEHAVDFIRTSGHVHGHWLKSAKWHLTLQFLGDFIDTRAVIEGACRAGASLHCAPFEFILDHVVTFPRRSGPPCVLCCSAHSERDLQSFQSVLGDALRTVGLGEHLDPRPYVPHVTIAYADDVLAQPIAIAPIVWRASSFALMDSLVGQSTHAEIEYWPLRA